MMVNRPGGDGTEQEQNGCEDGESSHFSYSPVFLGRRGLDWACMEEIQVEGTEFTFLLLAATGPTSLLLLA